MLFCGVKVETHDFKCEAFLVKLVGFVEIWLADQLAHIALLPFIRISFLPMLLCLFKRFLQIFFVFGIV